MAPNPADNSVEVMVAENESNSSVTSTKTASDRTITNINLYDNVGVLRKSQKVNNLKKYRLDLTGLKTGIYFVEISDGDYKERHQLIKK